jgi:hypothetical protein
MFWRFKMKMVKSLLLGSAAGLVAVAGAQAADLPVKAKPVQYVKICSLYGAGFYYVPGTDMCIKIGGWVRAEIGEHSNGSLTWGPFNNYTNTRASNNLVLRARGYITADARSQTAYGTVRGYIAVGVSENDTGFNTAANTFSSNRAFIQWAGFTFGRAQSFYDFYSVPATAYWGTYPASDTGDPGWLVFGYTAQFGNGWSATVSAEQRRMTQIINQNDVGGGAGTGSVAPGGYTTTVPGVTSNAGSYGGFNVPDIVGNIRVDQAWGGAQVMAALHEVNTNYYGGNTAITSGNPSDEWGFVVGGGLKLNAPMIGKGDYLQAQVNYAQGATRYVFMTPNTNWGYIDGSTRAFGVLSDSVYGGTVAGGTATGQNLTTAWGVNAAYEHFWNPAWRTSLYGGYAAISYNTQANAILCSIQGAGAGAGTAAVATAGCDNNWATAWVGTRTQWNVTKDFYMGVDVLYQNMKSASLPNGLTAGTVYTGFGTTNVSDQDNWSFRFRAHRDFYP